MSQIKIKVTGANEISRALTIIVGELNRVAQTTVEGALDDLLPKIKEKVPRKSGAAAASLRRSGALLLAGGGKAPYYAWLDFGGRVGRHKSVSRPWSADGRFIYPTVRAERDGIIDKAGERLVKEFNVRGLTMVRSG